ncbi:MAG: hypothetical protein P8Y71_24325 [Pseudolabrys sp.]
MYGLKHQKEKRSMNHFAGLDVSVKETSVCIVEIGLEAGPLRPHTVLVIEPDVGDEHREQAEDDGKAGHDESAGAHGGLSRLTQNRNLVAFLGRTVVGRCSSITNGIGGIWAYAEEALNSYCLRSVSKVMKVR